MRPAILVRLSKCAPLIVGASLIPAAAVAQEWTPVAPSEGVRLIQLVHDAQVTREAQYARGAMTAHVSHTGARKLEADVIATWDGDKLFLQLDRWGDTSINLEGLPEYREELPSIGVHLPTEEWVYIPSIPVILGQGREMSLTKPPDGVDPRPLRTWATFPLVAQLPLSDLLARILKESGKYDVFRDGTGQLKIRGPRGLVMANLNSGGDITRMELSIPTVKRGDDGQLRSSPLSLLVEFEWDRDARQVPFCRRYSLQQLAGEDNDSPGFTRELLVTEYDSSPQVPARRFSLEGIDPPVGTPVSFLGGKRSRNYRYGIKGEFDGATQSELEQLIESLRERGFAVPDR